MNKKILIIEYDKKLSRYIQLELEHEGYEVDITYDGKSGLEKALSEKYSLVILDIMLPKLNGIEVLRRIRQKSEIPVIMLTAKNDTIDKITGLDFGADDYITKPFEIEEFLARVRRFFRKKNNDTNNSIISSGELKINLNKHECYYKNDIIKLSKTEYDLLLFLMNNKDRVLTREQILENVWGFDYYGEIRVVDVYIRYLREKIDDKFKKDYISTIRGVGYLFKNE